MNLTYLRELFFSATTSSNKEQNTDIADKYSNMGYLEVYRAHHWEQRKRTGQITLIPNYTTGTCSVTKYSGTNEADAKTVTFSGATLTSSMIGRYLRVSTSSHWHKIVYLTGSTVSLDTPIVDIETGGSLSFEIWKRFYYLKSDVDVLTDFDKWDSARLGYKSDAEIVDQISNLSTTGTPYHFAPYGIDPYDDTEYTTGTIEVIADSNLVTGAGTSWLSSGIDTGDVLDINGTEYHIKRVETDTRIILFNSISIAVPSNSPYTIKKNNPLGFQFYNPSDSYRVLPYSYLGKAYPLVHITKDRILLPREFIPAIMSRAIYFRFRDTSDGRMTTQLQIYDAELTGLKQKFRVVKPRYMQFAPKIVSQMPGRGS